MKDLKGEVGAEVCLVGTTLYSKEPDEMDWTYSQNKG